MKIAIVAGGTGGHIYPGIAVAEEVRDRDPKAEVLFLGSSEGLEREILSREDFLVKQIKARALLRKLSYQAISAPFVSLIGFFQALYILKSFSPKVLVSFGGYAALPAVLAAKVLSIPVILHEQNVLPGMVNRLCRRLAQKIFLSFSESLKYISGEVVGNPVRKKIRAAKRGEARKKLNLGMNERLVLVMGGSQGSKKINEVVVSSLSPLPADVQIIHIIGNRDFSWVNDKLKGKNIKKYHPRSYIYSMEEVLAAADLVISRAGATAIAEFLIRGLPMVLVPFPHSAGNHQMLNARLLEDKNAALVVVEQDFTPEKFVSIINTLSPDYVKMSIESKKMSHPLAAGKIVDFIYA